MAEATAASPPESDIKASSDAQRARRAAEQIIRRDKKRAIEHAVLLPEAPQRSAGALADSFFVSIDWGVKEVAPPRGSWTV